MRYQVTVWKYDAETLDHRFECFTNTNYEAIEVFDTLTRGIRGYYRAWCIDLEEDKELRYSSVLHDSIGE